MPRFKETHELQYLPRNRQQNRLHARGLDVGILREAIPLFQRLCAVNIVQDFSDRSGYIST